MEWVSEMKNYLVQEVEILDGVGWGDEEVPGKGGELLDCVGWGDKELPGTGG